LLLGYTEINLDEKINEWIFIDTIINFEQENSLTNTRVIDFNNQTFVSPEEHNPKVVFEINKLINRTCLKIIISEFETVPNAGSFLPIQVVDIQVKGQKENILRHEKFFIDYIQQIYQKAFGETTILQDNTETNSIKSNPIKPNPIKPVPIEDVDQSFSQIRRVIDDNTDSTIIEQVKFPIIDIVPVKKYLRVALNMIELLDNDVFVNDVAILFEVDQWYVLSRIWISECKFKVDLAHAILFVYLDTDRICNKTYDKLGKSITQDIDFGAVINPVALLVANSDSQTHNWW